MFPTPATTRWSIRTSFTARRVFVFQPAKYAASKPHSPKGSGPIPESNSETTLLSTDIKLGADASIAVGPVGTGVAAQTADILLFSRDKGLFGGLTIEGSVLNPRDKWNAQYYGKPVRATDIMVKREVGNAGAEPLRNALAKASL